MEIEELKKRLEQDSWFEDTKKIEELEKENEQEHKVENRIIKILEEKYILKIKKLEEENIELRGLANKKQWISPCYVSQNYIPKSVIRDKIEELEKYEKLAKEQIENRIVIADSDSLNYGRAEAHSKDIQILKEILGDENG